MTECEQENMRLRGGKVGAGCSLWGISLSAVWDAVMRFKLERESESRRGGKKQWGDGDISDCRSQSCPAFTRVSALHLHCRPQNEACVTLWSSTRLLEMESELCFVFSTVEPNSNLHYDDLSSSLWNHWAELGHIFYYSQNLLLDEGGVKNGGYKGAALLVWATSLLILKQGGGVLVSMQTGAAHQSLGAVGEVPKADLTPIPSRAFGGAFSAGIFEF